MDPQARQAALDQLVAHFGPGILDPASRARGRERLAEAARRFPPEKFADLRARYGLPPR